ncbi:unnamed protein product, partial [Ectocarpus sp. 4 AP-2014]
VIFFGSVRPTAISEAQRQRIRGRKMSPVTNLCDEWSQLHTNTLAVLAAGSVDNDQGGGPQGLTTLMSAVSKDWAHIVEALLKRGANPSIEAEGGFTALHIGA